MIALTRAELTCDIGSTHDDASSLQAHRLQRHVVRMDTTVIPPETEAAASATGVSLDVSPLADQRNPPRGGLPLGAVLGVSISILVALLLGGLTAIQIRREERREITIREGLLGESLAPLVAEIERSSSLGEIAEHLTSGARAEIARGHTDFNLALRDGDGRVIDSVLTGSDTTPPPGSLNAQMPVRSALLKSGRGTLMAWQGAAGLAVDMAARRHAAWLDIGVAVLAIIVVVQLTIYVLVTRPLAHLFTVIEKVELGYPATLRQGDIARELRWLAWRFHRLSASLTNSARLLINAHRRAMEVAKSKPDSDIDPRLLDPLDLGHGGRSEDHEILRRYLRSRCALLEGFESGDPQARDVALRAWERDAVEAEKVGELELRSRVENAALMVLDPETFERMNHEIERMVDDRVEWCTATERLITSALVADGVAPVAIQRRTKHTAGVWRKMQEKNLVMEEVHDLIAFRIIVSSLDDCYLALDTVHRLFEPEPFRFKDYVAEPKANGYQSLHTSVCDRDGFVFEIQIRTVDMHRAAEEGGAAHWRYRARKSIRV